MCKDRFDINANKPTVFIMIFFNIIFYLNKLAACINIIYEKNKHFEFSECKILEILRILK